MRDKTAQDVYDELSADGEYKITVIDYNVIKKIMNTAIEDADYIDFLLQQANINWRIVYTLYYDVLRELCGALLRLDGTKVSNHQGCFAYICVKFPKLKFDWDFLEKIRTTRNRNKYEGSNIFQHDWKEVEIRIKLYISKIKKILEKKLKKAKSE